MPFFSQSFHGFLLTIKASALLLILSLNQGNATTINTNLPLYTDEITAPSSPIPTNLPSISPSISPKPQSTPSLSNQQTNQKTFQGDNYLLESHPSGEEGFFVLKNTPNEPMSSPDELNTAVNNFRKSNDRNQLFIDPQLCQIATQRAAEAESHFSHQGFEDHLKNGDYNYTGFNVMGENLWQGSFSGVHIVEFGWDRSPGHRANLLGDWSRGCAGIHNQTAAYIFVK